MALMAFQLSFHILLIVKEKINNIPSGQCLDMCPCAHAESNAIDNAARHGIAIKDSYLYCTNKSVCFVWAE